MLQTRGRVVLPLDATSQLTHSKLVIAAMANHPSCPATTLCGKWACTFSVFVLKAGSTSCTVRSTRTPPTKRKHFLPGSMSFNVSITRLHGGVMHITRGARVARAAASTAHATHAVPVCGAFD